MDETQRDIGELWGEIRELRADQEGKHREIMVILTGATGGNGMNGRLGDAEARIDSVAREMQTLREWGTHIWEVARPESCIGKKLVTELRGELDIERTAQQAALIDLKKTRMTMVGGIIGGAVVAFAPIVLELIKGAGK